MTEEAEVISTSPVPVKKGTAKTYSFCEALNLIVEGKRMSRLDWGSNEEYGFMKDEKLNIHTKGNDHVWWIQLGDIKANDWVIIPQVN